MSGKLHAPHVNSCAKQTKHAQQPTRTNGIPQLGPNTAAAPIELVNTGIASRLAQKSPAMAGDGELPAPKVEVVSPRDTSSIAQAADGPVASLRSSLEARADPDAQNTVTDFIDFTEYLPADIVRSLTLIGKLDETYNDASLKVNDLTMTWGRLPSLAARDRPSPMKLRAEISEQLSQAVNSRNYAHAEAVRMSQNINRHYQKAKLLLSKLQTMMDNYPTEDQKGSVEPKSPQMVRAKLTVRPTEGGPKKQRRVPRITVPGEVLAPYDIEYETFSDDSDISSDDDSDTPASRRTPGPPRIKLLTTNRGPKTIGRPARSLSYPSAAMSAAAAANAAALLNPPPPNAPVGSKDAPWLQLTQYELAVLRKRMKKNATWAPSETMIARELKNLGRGPEAYREAKKKAEEEGREFDPQVPTLVTDDESGTQQLPAGAISADCLAADDIPTSNRGMKLNEAKKLKREALAKMAAEEAEESARKMAAAAKLFLGSKEEQAAKARANARSRSKRKRDGDAEDGPETPDLGETPRTSKRTKTETPVPPPRHPSFQQENSGNSGNLTPSGGVAPSQMQTPVPIPMPFTGSATSPTPNSGSVTTTSVPVKPPAVTPVPLPRPERTVTPVYPPIRDMPSREAKRETRAEAEKRSQTPVGTGLTAAPDVGRRRSISRGLTPGAEASRRPGSRGKTMSQEPPSLASDRPRRASTARNTPNPEAKPAARRARRPAPGIVSTTSSGGNSAVGKRKAAPRKKARATKKHKGQEVEFEMEEVDDEGNPIDPNEARYCLCNRVSFGTMICCENADVSLSSVVGMSRC